MSIAVVQVLRVRRFKAGYIIRDEVWLHGTEYTPMKAAYGVLDFGYIGPSKLANRLCCHYGIQPQRRTKAATVCTIGFAAASRKWYGWSHRAIFGFGIGHVVKKGSVVAGRQNRRVGFKVKTLADAKRLACVFAEAVAG